MLRLPKGVIAMVAEAADVLNSENWMDGLVEGVNIGSANAMVCQWDQGSGDWMLEERGNGNCPSNEASGLGIARIECLLGLQKQ